MEGKPRDIEKGEGGRVLYRLLTALLLAFSTIRCILLLFSVSFFSLLENRSVIWRTHDSSRYRMGGGFDERKVERGLRVQFDASFFFLSFFFLSSLRRNNISKRRNSITTAAVRVAREIFPRGLPPLLLRSNSDTADVNRRPCATIDFCFYLTGHGYVTSPRMGDRNSLFSSTPPSHQKPALVEDRDDRDEAGNLHRVPPRRHPSFHLFGRTNQRRASRKEGKGWVTVWGERRCPKEG